MDEDLEQALTARDALDDHLRNRHVPGLVSVGLGPVDTVDGPGLGLVVLLRSRAAATEVPNRQDGWHVRVVQMGDADDAEAH